MVLMTTHKPGDFYPTMRDHGETVCNKCKNVTRSHRDHTGLVWCHKDWLKFDMGPQELAWAVENEAKHAAAEQAHGDRLREQAEVEAARLTPEWKKVREEGQVLVEQKIEEATAELGRMDPHERKVKERAIRAFAEGLASKTADQVLATKRRTARTAPEAESAASGIPEATGPSPDTSSGGSAAEPPTRSEPGGSVPAAEPSSSEVLVDEIPVPKLDLEDICQKCGVRPAVAEYEIEENQKWATGEGPEPERPLETGDLVWLCTECAREVFPKEYDEES